MKPYDELALMPRLIAETVCGEPYTGHEISNPCPSMVATVEAARQQMDVTDFASYADVRCRMAYENKADWFMKIARSRSNRGRDQLYMYVRHWLAAYLYDRRQVFTFTDPAEVEYIRGRNERRAS